MITMVGGSNLSICITINDQDNVPVDLTGATVSVTLAGPYGSFPINKQVLPTSLSNPSQGECLLALTPTSITKPGAYRYQCLIIFSDGSQVYSDQGLITVNAPL